VEANDFGSAELKLEAGLEGAYECAIIGRQLSRPPLTLLDETLPRVFLHLREALDNPGIPVTHHDGTAEGADPV
jgi:hypothetical protein